MSPDVSARISRFRSTWDAVVSPSRGRAGAALIGLSLFVGAHLARLGTAATRGLAVVGIVFTVVALIGRWYLARRKQHDVRRTIDDTVGSLDNQLAASIQRALTLATRAADKPDNTSPELANLHLNRALAKVKSDALTEKAAGSARVWTGVGLSVAAVAVASVAIDPLRVVEGVDVLVAADGEAPVPLVYVDEVELVVEPPAYLRSNAQRMSVFRPSAQPVGSVITMRGTALAAGRDLVLTDGTHNEPFVDDGRGGIVAHWTLMENADLRVAAVFGDVRIYQHEVQHVEVIPDLAPVVDVEQAPAKHRLLEVSNIPITYDVSDDHGVRQVDLVLRAGDKEERRVLSRPNGDTRVDRGGYELSSRDKFLQGTYLPIEVTVQARDNDEVTGPKWGVSDNIILIPPQIGEPEAMRFKALIALRDLLTDTLAARMTRDLPPTSPAETYKEEETQLHTAFTNAAEELMEQEFGGLYVTGPARALIKAEIEALNEAVDKALAAPGPASHRKLVDKTEEVLLALDSGLQMLATADGRNVSKRLADVADETADSLYMLRTTGDVTRHEPLVEASISVLDGGGEQLIFLGHLGADLGEITQNGLRRIKRARDDKNERAAELAARDLAERLRNAQSSLDSSGQGHGVESGPGQGGDPRQGDASEADDDIQKALQELAELAREHQQEMSEVQNALDEAVDPKKQEELRKEAQKRAKEIREAIKNLPDQGGPRDSAEGAAVEARRQAEAMAEAFERGEPQKGIGAAEQAIESLKRAAQQGKQSDDFFDQRAGEGAEKAQPTIQEQLEWAERALEEMRQSASEQAGERLQQSGKDEAALSERAKELSQPGENGTPLPGQMRGYLEEASKKMREAQDALRQGDGAKGLEKQREAQRLLEMAQAEAERDMPQQDDNTKGESPSNKDGDEGKEMAQETDVPNKDDHEGPEAFRKRVMEGLSDSRDARLKEAVKRYAEGLLQ